MTSFCRRRFLNPFPTARPACASVSAFSSAVAISWWPRTAGSRSTPVRTTAILGLELVGNGRFSRPVLRSSAATSSPPRSVAPASGSAFSLRRFDYPNAMSCIMVWPSSGNGIIVCPAVPELARFPPSGAGNAAGRRSCLHAYWSQRPGKKAPVGNFGIRGRKVTRLATITWLHNATTARQAILAAVVLGPPKALEPQSDRHPCAGREI